MAAMIDPSADSYDERIAQGIALRTRHEWAAAVREFAAACALRPNSLGARCELAFTHLEAGQVDEAWAIYSAVDAADARRVDALAGLGEISRRRGDLTSALTYFQQAAAIDGERLSLQCDIASVFRDLGRFDEAREAFEEVLRCSPGDWRALVGLGLLSRQRGGHAAAVTLFRQAVTHYPDHPGIRLELALSLRDAGQNDAAINEYEAVLSRDSTNAGALVGLAILRRQAGDPNAALDLLGRALTRDPDNPSLHLEQAAALREALRLDEAESAYRAILGAQPDSWPALVGVALVARERGDHAAALVGFERAVTLQPSHAGVKDELALTLRLLGRFDEAEQIYQRVAAENPLSAGPVQGLSLIALARGHLDAAIEFAQKACALEPDAVPHALLLAALYRDVGRSGEAQSVVARCLVTAPRNPRAWMEQGQLMRLRGDRVSALAVFEHAVSLGEERSLLEAAAEHLALGRPDRAQAAYEQLLAVSPLDLAALLGMAELNLLADQFLQCMEICNTLIAQYPRRVTPYLYKCRALVQLDRADEALRIAGELETLIPDSMQADAARLEIYRTCGRREEAEKLMALPRVAGSREFGLWLEGALARLAFFDVAGCEAQLADPPAIRPFEHSRVFYVRGLLADLQWRIDDAIRAFERALEMHADDSGAHHHLARLYFLRADADGATTHLAGMTQKAASALSLRGQSRNVSQNLIGQLVNELRLDEALSARLAALRRQAMPRRIDELFAMVASDPWLTPPAIFLMQALREAGVFEPAAQNAIQSSTMQIPRKIMQYWDQRDPPAGIVQLLHTWVDAHPGFTYSRFDDATAREYLVAQHPQSVLNAYRRASHPAQKSDLFRLAYLFREGGFYVDADDRCIGSLASIVPRDAVFTGYQEQYATLGNNFIGCLPGDAVIGRALALAVETLRDGDADTIWLATGPGLMTRAFAEVLVAQDGGWREWLSTRRIFDRREVSAVSWPHSISLYKTTRRGWLNHRFRRTAQRIS